MLTRSFQFAAPGRDVPQEAVQRYESTFPRVKEAVFHGSWVDDIAQGAETKEEIIQLMHDLIFVLAKSSFYFKAFMLSGEKQQRDGTGKPTEKNILKGEEGDTKCLSIKIAVNTTPRVRKKFTGPDDEHLDLPKVLAMKFTRAALLSVVCKTWDPWGS